VYEPRRSLAFILIGAPVFTSQSRAALGITLGAMLGAAAGIAILVSPRALAAQGSVSGRITIQERADAKTPDLANAVVYLEPVTAAGAPATSRAAEPVTAQIAMESRTFIPHVRVVPVGSTVEFPNQDPFRHNVFSNSGPTEFDLGLYGRGESKGAALRKPGVFTIFCNIHARMSAFVLAVATPHFTQAGADGRFTLAGVPAGRYTLRVWHDRGGTADTQVLDVPGSGVQDAEVRLDARGYKAAAHKNKFGQEYTATGRDRY